MKRRGPKRQTNSPSAARAHTINQCRAVVLVDGSAIRKKIKKAYEKALRDLDKSRRDLDQFHQTDLPRFTRWLNAHFGELLTELRELSQKLAADEELIFLVQGEVMFNGGSQAQAYKRVVEIREDLERRPHAPDSSREPDGEPNGERDPFGARDESSGSDGEEDPLEEFFNDLFGEFGSEGRPRDKQGRRDGRKGEPLSPAHQAARLKELYRSVVRRLHPDTQKEMTVQKTEWWHQAQAAYEAGDADQLEVILTLCEIGDSGTTAHTSASLLQRITEQMKRSLREIKRELVERKCDPAWNFSHRRDHGEMAAGMRLTLTGDLEGMRREWRLTQAKIAAWKAAAERLREPRRRKPRQRNEDCPF